MIMNDYFSVWTFIRSSGFLSLFFLTLSLSFGFISSFTSLKKKKGFLIYLHQTSGWYGFLTLLFHMALIWRDQYVPYSLGELLLPFSAKHSPIFSALGTISFYLFFIVIVSSDFFIKKFGVKLWKKVHLLVIPAWMSMIVHGMAIGTDSIEPWAIFIYAGAITLIIVLVVLRILEVLVSKNLPKKNETKGS